MIGLDTVGTVPPSVNSHCAYSIQEIAWLPGERHIDLHANPPLRDIFLPGAARTASSSVDRSAGNDFDLLSPPGVSAPIAFCPPVANELAAIPARLLERTATGGHARDQ